MMRLTMCLMMRLVMHLVMHLGHGFGIEYPPLFKCLV